MHRPHLPWLLHRSAWSGIGVGVVFASIVFYYIREATMLASLKIGLAGLTIFLLTKKRHRKHH